MERKVFIKGTNVEIKNGDKVEVTIIPIENNPKKETLNLSAIVTDSVIDKAIKEDKVKCIYKYSNKEICNLVLSVISKKFNIKEENLESFYKVFKAFYKENPKVTIFFLYKEIAKLLDMQYTGNIKECIAFPLYSIDFYSPKNYFRLATNTKDIDTRNFPYFRNKEDARRAIDILIDVLYNVHIKSI